MDKAKDLAEEPTAGTENAASSGVGLESEYQHAHTMNAENKAADIGTTQGYADPQSVQIPSSPGVVQTLDQPKSNRQDESNKSQPHNENIAKKGSGTEDKPNPKKAKQRLRKGKWTIEEEEYTSRIIQYFSTGLLTLPDGATLRSYLAEKLNCDPMRITKKFTGACCLGRRAYHLRDRPRASPAEIEMASFELLHLEQRFRLRVEHEQTGLPLPPRQELLASQPTQAATVVPSLFTLQQGTSTAKATNHWIQNPVLAPSPGHASLLPGLAGLIPNATIQNPNTNLNLQNSSSLLLAAGQLLLQNQQNQNARTHAGNSTTATATAPLQMLNNLVASYALSRALTQQQAGISILQPPGPTTAPLSSSAPKETAPNPPQTVSALNFGVSDIPKDVTKNTPQPSAVQSRDQFSNNVQLHRPQHDNSSSSIQTPQISKKEEHTKKLKAAFEEQQKALRIAYEKSLRDAQEWEEKSSATKTEATSDPKGTKPTSDAKTSLADSKSSLETLSPAEQLQRSYEAHLKSLQQAEQQAALKAISNSASATASQTAVPQPKNATTRGTSSDQDEEEGAILLGFLNSLRESFKDAIEAKDRKHEPSEGNSSNSKSSTGDASEGELTSNVQRDSSTGTSEGSESVIHVAKSRSSSEHLGDSMKSRRQMSEPITSLSHFQASKRKVKPASVTETSSSTSSQPTSEQPSSSQEDSKSDKMGSSSSEDSDKEITSSIRSSKGPPRKRLKGFHEPHEFTRENLMAHSKRMDMECGQSSDVSSSDD